MIFANIFFAIGLLYVAGAIYMDNYAFDVNKKDFFQPGTIAIPFMLFAASALAKYLGWY